MRYLNSKLELFMLEHPDTEEMIKFLCEDLNNTLMSIEYSDWIYDNGDALVVAGLIEWHGDKVVEPLYNIFGKEMHDDIIDVIENAPLTSIHYMPQGLIGPRVISLYANAGIVRGIDDFVDNKKELLGYYRIAAENVPFSDTSAFYCIWNKEDDTSREILTRRYFEQSILTGECKEVRDTLLNYFKSNYELFPDFNSETIYKIARYDNQTNYLIDTIEYFNIMMNCNKVRLSSSIWLMKRLLNRGYKNLFEELVLKLDWSSEILYEYEYEEERIYKKIRKILRKNKIKYIKYLY